MHVYEKLDGISAWLLGFIALRELLRLERGKMGFPGRGRAVGGQLDAENRGTVRRNRDEDGGLEGKNLIAEVKHHRCRGHRQRGG